MTQIFDGPTNPPLPPGAHWGPPPPPAKKSWGKYLAVFGAIFTMSLVAIAALSSGGGAGSAFSTTPKTHTVTYRVEGSASVADITYENAFGDTSQESDIDVPLTRERDGGQGLILNDMEKGDFLYISAQNGDDSGSITCIIEVDGVVVKTNTSRGGYTIATCSGRL